MSDKITIKQEESSGESGSNVGGNQLLPYAPKRLGSGRHKKSTNNNNSMRTRPAFVMKLWNMVNDMNNIDHIRWTNDGTSFEVLHREFFEKEVLPKYFKHSNFSSFVRQLNMYGWHKVQDVTTTTPNSSNNEEIWQFKSPNFIQGREDLLDNIVRNKNPKGGSDDEEEVDLSRILKELNTIKKNQREIGDSLLQLEKDNKILWEKNSEHNERHQRHSQTLDRILRFLASLYGNQSTKLLADAMIPSDEGKLLLGKDGDDDNNNNNNKSRISSISSTPDTRKDPTTKNNRRPSMTLDLPPNEFEAMNNGATTSNGSLSHISSGSSSSSSNPPLAAPATTNAPLQTPRAFFPELGYIPPPSDVAPATNDSTTPAFTSSPSFVGSDSVTPIGFQTNKESPNYDQVQQNILQNDNRAHTLIKHLDLQDQSLNQVETLLSQYSTTYGDSANSIAADIPIGSGELLSEPQLEQIPDPEALIEPLPKFRKTSY